MEKVNVVDSAAIIRHFTKDHSKLAYLRQCRDRVEPSFISSLSHSSKTKEAINHIIISISRLIRSTMPEVAGNSSAGAARHAIQPLRQRFAIIHLLLCAFLSVLVDGHGHMTSPRSRNWLATAGQDGVNSATPEKPDAEYCTHCLNVNDP